MRPVLMIQETFNTLIHLQIKAHKTEEEYSL